MANTIFLTAIFAGIVLLIKKRMPQQKKDKASDILENVLFPEGNVHKRKVIEAFNKITNNNYSDEEILDFFMKEKGLQLISINVYLPSSVKKFIRKDTLIDLNYFERVKFHELFINYPLNLEVQKIENSETIFKQIKIGTSIAAEQRIAV